MKEKRDKPIKDVLKNLVKHYKLEDNFEAIKVKEVWERTMGTTIMNYTKKINFSKGKLFVQIDASSLKQELASGKDKIKKILNEELAGNPIQEVIIY